MQALLQMLSGSKAGGVQEDAFMALGTLIEGNLCNRQYCPRFVLPTSSHVTILFGSLYVMQFLAFMAQVFIPRNLLKKPINFLSRD